MEERLYDLIFICMPTTPEEEIAKIMSTLEQTAPSTAARWRKWRSGARGRWPTAWPNSAKGYYVYMALRSARADLIKELERRLKVSDAVIKYMTVRLDEEIKRQQKLVAHREHRARRRPRKPMAAASSSSSRPAPPAAPTAAPAARAGRAEQPAASSGHRIQFEEENR